MKRSVKILQAGKQAIAAMLVTVVVIALIPLPAQALTAPASITVTAYIGKAVSAGEIDFRVVYTGSGNGRAITHSGDSLPPGLVLDSSSPDLLTTDYQIIGTVTPDATLGVHPIKYTHDGCTDFGANCGVSIALTVAKGPLTIVCPDKTVALGSQATVTLMPGSTDGNGNPIGAALQPTYTFGGGAAEIATIDAAGVVTIVGPGTTSFTVNSAETNNYQAATQHTVNFTVTVSSDNAITSFSIPGGTTTINGTSITVTMPAGTDLTNLQAAYTLSADATIDPDPDRSRIGAAGRFPSPSPRRMAALRRRTPSR